MEFSILPGDVLFVWGDSLIEECIEHVTHGPSHVAIFLDTNTLAEAQGGRVTGSIALTEYLNGGSRLEVWRDESLTDEERANMVAYAQSHFGIHYDYLEDVAQLARFELDFPISHEGKKRICSTYVNDIALSVGHHWSTVPVPAPVDLIKGGKLTLKGALTDAGVHGCRTFSQIGNRDRGVKNDYPAHRS